MIMVTVLVAVTAMILFPPLTNFLHSWDLELEAKKIAADLRLMQQRSILEAGGSDKYGVRFNPLNETYDLISYNGLIFTTLETKSLRNGIDLMSTDFSTFFNRLYFDQFGATQGISQNEAQINLTDFTHNAIIRVECATGRIKVDLP